MKIRRISEVDGRFAFHVRPSRRAQAARGGEPGGARVVDSASWPMDEPQRRRDLARGRRRRFDSWLGRWC